MSKTFQFSLPGITCSACVASVENALKSLQEARPELKISKYSVNLAAYSGSITVDDESLDDVLIRKTVKEALDDCGFDVEDFILDPEVVAELRRKRIRNHIIKGVIGLACGAAIMALMMSGLAIPFFAMVAIVAAGSLLTLFLGAHSYWDAAKKLFKARTLTMDTLFTVSTLTVIGVSIASLFVPWLSMMMEAALLILGFRQLGDALLESLEKKAALGVVFTDRAVKNVQKRKGPKLWEICKSRDVAVGDTIKVMSGEVIPVDGKCKTKSTFIHTAIKTGDPLPARIERGDEILAGMIVPSDVPYITLTVDRVVSQSNLAQLAKKVELAGAEQAPLQEVTVKITQYFIPAVFLLAIISGVLIGIFFTPALAVVCAISILVALCPCILGLIAPRALKMGMSKAIDHGIQFKSEKHLQLANEIDIVFFDMHGTFTQGKPEITEFHCYPGLCTTPKKLFRVLAEIEKASRHPIAQLIQQYAESRSDAADVVILNAPVDQKHHAGIKAIVDGDEYCVGNRDFFAANYPRVLQGIHVPTFGVEQVIYVVKNGILVSHIKIQDPLREDAKFVVEELLKQGKTVGIISGADQQIAEQCAAELGIASHIYGGQNSAGKEAIIQHHKDQNKKVAMVGDSGNDTLPITRSHLGIAVKSASYDQATLDAAGATIDKASLVPVLAAFAVSKQTVYSIKQNLILSLTYNTVMALVVGGVLLAVVGFALNPAIGAALMVASAILIILNQYRLSRQALPHEAAHKKLQDDLAAKQQLGSSHHSMTSLGLSPTSTAGLTAEHEIENDSSAAYQPLLHSPKSRTLENHSPPIRTALVL